MKLLVDCIPFDHGKSGISVYMRNVVRELSKTEHDITILVEPSAAEFFPNNKLWISPWFVRYPALSMLYHLFLLPLMIPKGRFDRILVLAANRRMMAWAKCELVSVIHDLSQYHVPMKYDRFRMFYIQRVLPYYVRHASDEVVAISRCTAADLLNHWNIPEGKLAINHNGIERAGLPLGKNDASSNIILYISRLEAPGKNHVNLIKAWEMLPREFTSTHKLVLAGADWRGADIIRKRAADSPCRDSIEFPGFVDRAQICEWYRVCKLYVFPSFFEGFGLSLAEAMACGAVCACSNNSSLAEIGENAALMFDPWEPQSIADAIYKGATDEALRADLRRKGMERSELFDWAHHSKVLTSPFERFAEVLGVRFSTCTMPEAVADVRSMVESGKKHFCCFVNADCINQSFGNPAYAGLLRYAHRVWADGVGVAIAARHVCSKVYDNVNGTDMLPHLCRAGFKMFLLGGAPGVSYAARRNLQSLYPEAKIVGDAHGFFIDTKLMLEDINASGADILLVGMGVPKQEFWIAQNLSKLDCKVCIGVGGLLDFASGKIPRAPRWMRKCKLEWLYRLRQEPIRLFRRYVIGNPLFLLRVWLYGSQRKKR